MPHPSTTYELRVSFQGAKHEALRAKERLLDWLLVNGVESFVEGSIDVDINQNQDEPPRDYYSELGGDLSPVSIYRFSCESLEDLKIKLHKDFPTGLDTILASMPTQEWMEGWKDSFKPFTTAEFHVRPPWVGPANEAGRLELVIEPGMAFGTGQHATTRLCLEQLGLAREASQALSQQRVLDVGTGTGILAIGAKLLGYGYVLGTDIEDDAILAAAANAKLNHTDVHWIKGSLPRNADPFDVVFANILAVVLLRMLPELKAQLKPGGRLILSGLLVEEEEELLGKAASLGFLDARAERLAGWSCLSLTRGPLP